MMFPDRPTKSSRLGTRAQGHADRAVRVVAAVALVAQASAPAMAQTAPAPTALQPTALPQGGRVVSGSSTIRQPQANAVTIDQSSQRGIINWQSFSVGQQGTVTFNQPNAASATLNRVTGDTPSTLAGQVHSNGQVYLVNPNGIAITASGTVDTGGGFVASTLGIADGDFNAGRANFKGQGASAGVVNQGVVTTGRGGFVGLIGGAVSNEGTITVPLGRVGLGSGETATLDLTGDGFMQVAVPSGARASNGKALVQSSGKITADGGTIELKAASVREAIRDTVNVSGDLVARSVSGRNGAITLGGGDGGVVTVSGRLDASAKPATTKPRTPVNRVARETGGRIDVSGQAVRLSGATLTATGSDQGGLIRVGGAFRGGKTVDPVSQDYRPYIGRWDRLRAIANADTTSIDAATRIDASATGTTGIGGTVVVWSNLATSANGRIATTGSAKGGAVEISSAGVLKSINTAGLDIGRGGRLLFDPKDILVEYGTGTFDAAGTYVYDGSSSVTRLNAQALTDLLVRSGTNVTLQASNDITWNGGIGASSDNTYATNFGSLTLNAGRSLFLTGHFNLNRQQAGADGNIVLRANDAGATGPRDAGTAEINLAAATIDVGSGLRPNGTPNGGGNVTITMGRGQPGNPGGLIMLNTIDARSVTVAQQGTGDRPWIQFNGDVSTTGGQTYTGPLVINPQTSSTLKLTAGTTINWTDEATSLIAGYETPGTIIEFREAGKLTRYGVLDRFTFDPVAGVVLTDATRLAVGPAGSLTLSRLYGDANPTISRLSLVRGALQAGDTLDTIVDPVKIQIAAGPAPRANVGAYAIAITAAQFGFALATSNQNYFIDTRDRSLPLTITPRTLSYICCNATGTYGSASVPTPQLAGVLVGDEASVGIAGSQISNTGGLVAFGARTPVGSYTISATALVGGLSSNYRLPVDGPSNPTLTITPKVLPYTFSGLTGIYGSAPTANLFGIVAGDTVDGQVHATPGTLASPTGVALPYTATTRVGSYVVSVGALTGPDAANYRIGAGPTPEITIQPKPIFASVGGTTSVFGDGSTLVTTLSGVLTGDAVNATTRVSIGGAQLGGVQPTTNAGTYGASTSLTGSEASNYVVTGGGASTVTVTPRPVGVSFVTASFLYGNTGPLAGLVSLSNVMPADQASLQPIVDTSTNGGQPVSYNARLGAGNYTARVLGMQSGNYMLDPAAVTTAPFTVTPRPLIVTLGNVSAVYGNGLVVGDTSQGTSARIDGLVNGEVATLSPRLLNGAGSAVALQPQSGGTGGIVPADTAAGAYQLSLTNPVGANGFDPRNYTLTTGAPATVTIDRRPVTYSVANVVSTYGTQAAPTATLFGILRSDSVSGTVVTRDANGSFVLTPRTPVGTYAASASSLTGPAAGNYVLAATGNTDGAVTVQPKALTWSLADQQTTYGFVPGPQATLTGVLLGETVTPVVTTSNGLVAITERPGLDAGTYVRAVTGLNGLDAGNYRLPVGGGGAFAALTILPRQVTVQVGSASIFYRDTIPALDYQITRGGFLPDDNVLVRTGALIGAGNVGTYQTTATYSGHNVGGNYAITTRPGTLAIARLPISATLTGLSVVYGDVNAGLVGDLAVSFRRLDGTVVSGVPHAFSITGDNRAPIVLDRHLGAGLYEGRVDVTDANYLMTGGGVAGIRVTPRPLAPNGSLASVVYGARPGAIPLDDIVPGDEVGARIGSIVRTSGRTVYDIDQYWTAAGGLQAGVGSRVPIVGTYAVDGIVLSGAASRNYAVNRAALATGHYTFAITPKPVYVSSLTGLPTTNFRYGDAFPYAPAADGTYYFPGTAGFSGLVYAADAASIVPAMSSWVQHVGTRRSATLGTLAGGGLPAGAIQWWSDFSVALADRRNGQLIIGCTASACISRNYTMAQPDPAKPFEPFPSAPAAMTIDRRPVSYTVTDTSTVYGTAVDQTVTLNNVLERDRVNLGVALGYSTAGGGVQALSGAGYAGSNRYTTTIGRAPVDSYGVAVNAFTGTAAGNYVPEPSGSVPGTLIVTPKPLTYTTGSGVSYEGLGRLGYAGLDGLGTYSLSGLLPGDIVAGELRLNRTGLVLPLTKLQFLNLRIGQNPIELAKLTGRDARNYTIATTGNTIGVLDVQAFVFDTKIIDWNVVGAQIKHDLYRQTFDENQKRLGDEAQAAKAAAEEKARLAAAERQRLAAEAEAEAADRAKQALKSPGEVYTERQRAAQAKADEAATAKLQAEFDTRQRQWSISAIDLTAEVSAPGVTAKAEETLSVKIDALNGLVFNATVGVEGKIEGKKDGFCGEGGTCMVSGGAYVSVGAHATGKSEIGHAEFDLGIGANAGIKGETAFGNNVVQYTVAAGLDTGGVNAGGSGTAQYENGHLKIGAGLSLELGIGVSLNMGVDLNIGAVGNFFGDMFSSPKQADYTVFVDPKGAAARFGQQNDINRNLAEQRAYQYRYLAGLLNGRGDADKNSVAAMTKGVDTEFGYTKARAETGNFALRQNSDGRFVVDDRDPPKTAVLRDRAGHSTRWAQWEYDHPEFHNMSGFLRIGNPAASNPYGAD